MSNIINNAKSASISRQVLHQAQLPAMSTISALAMQRSMLQETILCNPVSARASGLTRETCSRILTQIELCFVQIKAFKLYFCWQKCSTEMSFVF